MLRFKLDKTARHSELLGVGESIRKRFSDFVNRHKQTILAGGMGVIVAGMLSLGAPAVTYASEITDTTTQPTVQRQMSDQELQELRGGLDNTSYDVQSSPAVVDNAVETPSEPAVVQNVEEPVEVQVVETTPEVTVSQETTPEVSTENTENTNEISQNETIDNAGQEITQTEQSEVTNDSVQEVQNEETSPEIQEDEVKDATATSEEVTPVVSEDPVTAEDSVSDEITSSSENQNTDDEQTVNVTENGYKVIETEGEQLFIIGDDFDIPALVEEYGEDKVTNAQVFTWDWLNENLKVDVETQLNGLDLMARKTADGVIEIMDANGNVIMSHAFENQIEQDQDVEQDQEIEQDQTQDAEQSQEPVNSVPDDLKDSSTNVEVNYNEVAAMQDSNGHYYFALGGTGLNDAHFQDLLANLQAQGVIPADADYSWFILPTAPTPEMQQAGITERILKITDDLYVSTKDGVTFVFYSYDQNLLQSILTYESDQLNENYNNSNNPNAQTGKKPGEGPNEEIPGEKPGVTPPEEVTPPNEPEAPAYGGGHDLPQTGDAALLASAAVAAAGTAAMGAGVASSKKKKKQTEEDEFDEDYKMTYDDLDELDKNKKINPHDYDDDLELFAKAWVLSKEQENNVKGKQR